jgi:hypothetical protein
MSTPALEITKFCLSFNGLNFAGIDSHVLRPMITAFCPSCVSVVVVAEISDLEANCQVWI